MRHWLGLDAPSTRELTSLVVLAGLLDIPDRIRALVSKVEKKKPPKIEKQTRDPQTDLLLVDRLE